MSGVLFILGLVGAVAGIAASVIAGLETNSLLVFILAAISASALAAVLLGLSKILDNQEQILHQLDILKGHSINSEKSECPNCSKVYESDMKSCPHCGQKRS